MLLSNENLSEDMRDEVLGAYYDQAHLIRDVRRYTGRTPKGFSEKSISQDTLNPVAHGRNANALLSNPRSRYRKQSR